MNLQIFLISYQKNPSEILEKLICLIFVVISYGKNRGNLLKKCSLSKALRWVYTVNYKNCSFYTIVHKIIITGAYLRETPQEYYIIVLDFFFIYFFSKNQFFHGVVNNQEMVKIWLKHEYLETKTILNTQYNWNY